LRKFASDFVAGFDVVGKGIELIQVIGHPFWSCAREGSISFLCSCHLNC
jgi:hypothetical protein